MTLSINTVLSREEYDQFLNILREELVPALGCTEPIAIAYAAAKARAVLEEFPEKIVVECSGNVIKNVSGVIVPTTKNLRGIKSAAIIGAVGGNANKELEVLSGVTEQDLEKTKPLIKTDFCEERLLQTPAKLHIIVHMYKNEHHVKVEIVHTHLGIVRIEKDDAVLLDIPHDLNASGEGIGRGALNVKKIIEFADTVQICDVADILDKQIEYNTNISREGLSKKYGANVGITLLSAYGNDVKTRAKASAAAGSDARMSGCEMPVIINSGSGNQGMTASLPVIEYAKELCVSKEKLYRALCLSNLIAIYQKSKIGRLSAYCGAVCAAAGAGAAVTYLHGGGINEISQTIINTLGNVSGIVCDGAKPSCAAKIASSVDAAIMAFTMAMQDRYFKAGEGLVKDGVESTIDSISAMACDGMKATDEEILKLMLEA